MFPAARKLDPVTHDLLVPSGVIGPPSSGPCPLGPVLVEGFPAAHVNCMAVCTGVISGGIAHPPPPTPGSPIIKGSVTVFIHGMPAARWSPAPDMSLCGVMLGDPKLTATRTVLIGDQGPGTAFGPGPLTPEQAQLLFDILAAQEYIAFKYRLDGCYSRAHLMVQLMQRMGLSPGKAWTFRTPPDLLRVTTPAGNIVEWRYHVAPTITVQEPGQPPQEMVLDPSLSDKPMTVTDWKNAQNDTPTLQQKGPNEAPTASGGTGYWPGPDPAGGKDQDAWETMQNYKPLEPSPP